ncbi:hypothetical protein LIER_30334 [Lithospermum erythrorhizon]|uniref:ATP-dependent DNA helicase n=1 Tax=Lithospermum erythrorhizon TaxID=34254 RepID=A0AAV3RMT2_LITER
MERAILCPKNESVDDINSRLIQRLTGKEVIYISDDRAKNLMDQGDYIDYLTSLEPRGLPPHKLLLKINSPDSLEPNLSDNKYSIPFVRRQIPLKLCFAMTINKSQAQTLDFVGIYLRQPVFTHGQLYVAMSRVKTGKNIRVLIIPPTCNDLGTKYTTNVVYKEVLSKTRLN